MMRSVSPVQTGDRLIPYYLTHSHTHTRTLSLSLKAFRRRSNIELNFIELCNANKIHIIVLRARTPTHTQAYACSPY